MTKAEAALKLIDIAAGVELIGNHENAEAIRMGANALREPPTTLMGYRIEELQVLAELLRDQYVSPIEVTRLCNDASYMYHRLKAQIMNEVREAMTPPKLPKMSPWDEEKEGLDK